jgi:hypothetical protein
MDNIRGINPLRRIFMPRDIKGVQMMLGDLFFMERIYRHRITDAVFGKGYRDACLEDRKSVKDL